MRQKLVTLFAGWVVLLTALFAGIAGHNYDLQAQNKKEFVETVLTPQDSIRNLLVDEVSDYLAENHPRTKITPDSLVDRCLEENFDIVFALAQGANESGMGVYGLANKTNSVWNVGAFDGQGYKGAKKRGCVFDHPDESISPYIKLIKNKYLGAKKSLHDLFNNFVTLGGHRYASGKQYETKLKSKYNKIKTKTKIFELQQEYLNMEG